VEIARSSPKGEGMKKGDKVMIYRRPISEREPEGEARLLRCLNSDAGIYNGRLAQHWEVEFGDGPESVIVQRTVLAK